MENSWKHICPGRSSINVVTDRDMCSWCGKYRPEEDTMATMPEPKKFSFTNHNSRPIFGVTARSHLIGCLVVQERDSVSTYYGVKVEDLQGICSTHGFHLGKLYSDLLKMEQGTHTVFVMADQYRGN